MPTKTEAIQSCLLKLARADLAKLYNYNMEVQVNVAQDDGERISGEFKGKSWSGFTDGLTTWKSFRVPWNANTEPEYNDTEIKFNLHEHVEAIGMTGWDWVNRVSRWVAFDFDSLIGHKSGLSNLEIDKIKELAHKVPYVTVRKSTGGNGLHYYIFLNAVKTKNHCEHQALARAILSQLSAETGFDFHNKVDICGGNMWVWHRRMHPTYGLQLIKQGQTLCNIPPNWQDHIKVVTGSRRKNLPQDISNVSEFDQLTGQYIKVPLDDEHKRLIDYLKETDAVWWWDQDNHMMVTHTIHLKEAHRDLNLKGIFETNSTGKDKGHDHNCFLFPNRNGSWVVRRFSPGCTEHPSWDQDNSGYTRCYYNTDPNLDTSSRTYDGVEHPTGGYVFNEAESAQKVALQLGADLNLPMWALGRPTKIKYHKDGRLLVEIDKESTDNPSRMQGWLADKTKWKRIFNIAGASTRDSADIEIPNYDDVVRHIVTEDKDAGWVIKSNNVWVEEPLTHVKAALRMLGLNDRDVTRTIGDNIFRRWTLVNKPFEPEYTGDREWNRDACQFNYLPSQHDNLNYPTWNLILNHVGANLKLALEQEPWSREHGILTGADYLKCWIASIFQYPTEPLPYLFLFGPEASGKSIFHEALSLLISAKGYQRAETALRSQQAFNGELKSAIICIIEEVDLSGRDKTPYTRIKDWVTATHLPIHPKNGTPYVIKNTTHWIQCSNELTACPVFPGDTRITMIHVEKPNTFINKNELFINLKKEAADFLGEVTRLELPKSPDRLNIPVLRTSEKAILQQQNQNALEQFIDECCYLVPGSMVKLSEFHDKFVRWLDPSEVFNWSVRSIGKHLPLPYVKGRGSDSQFYIGNMSLTQDAAPGIMLTVLDNKLVPKSVSYQI